MNEKSAELFKKIISSETKFKVKLLGDSITHGVGGTGFKQDGQPIVGNFARNPNGYCWAKQFKEYMESKYDCEVNNNACTGTNIEFILKNFDVLVDEDDDIVICTIGTNNRHQYFKNGPKHTKEEHMAEFYANILTLHGKFKDASKKVIFMANIPASDKNEQDGAEYWRIFHMNDVRDMYKRASDECGFAFVSLYDLFSAYCADNGVELDSLLGDGLHPNDRGYDVMFGLITGAFEV